MESFKALVTREFLPNQWTNLIESLPLDFLQETQVLIKVHYSSLNFKDALSFNGHRGITKKFPHIPGIDALGEVVQDSSQTFMPGTKVLVTGFDLGMNTHGGFSEYINVPKEWVIQLPEQLVNPYLMELGTAGLTAGMAINQLIKNDVSKDLPILVSGASGGVGLIALILLKKLGFTTHALTRKKDLSIFQEIEVDKILDLDEFLQEQSRALYPMNYAGAIDTVGGEILVKIIKSISMGGSVAVCGMAHSTALPLEVYPFILRGIKVLGINSAESPLEYKKFIWEKLCQDWKIDLHKIVEEICLEQVPSHLQNMLGGTSFGRKIVRIIP